MKYIWILFIIIAIEDIVFKKLNKNKKELAVYVSIVLISVILCISYYNNEYDNSLLKMVNSKINLERYIWIK